MRYVEAKVEDAQLTQAYRFYIADCLYYASQDKSMKLQSTFRDLLKEAKKPKQSAEDVIRNLIDAGVLKPEV